jgi:hypothetical protein
MEGAVRIVGNRGNDYGNSPQSISSNPCKVWAVDWFAVPRAEFSSEVIETLEDVG